MRVACADSLTRASRSLDLLLPFFLMLPVCLTLGPATASPCRNKHVKTALEACYPQLSAIHTSILHTRAADSHATTCSYFHKYVVCVEPYITGCKSPLLGQYFMRRATYTGPPYNCKVPDVTPSPVRRPIKDYKFGMLGQVTSASAVLNPPGSCTFLLSTITAISFLF